MAALPAWIITTISLSFLSIGLISAEPSVEVDASLKMRNIWSPYCKGVSLMECPSSQAEKLRAEITERMKAGENFDDIYANLVSRYGSTLRMAPDSSGREGLAYWMPWMALVGIVLLLSFFWLKRGWRGRRSRAKAVASPTSTSHRSQILSDLKDRLES